MKIYKEDIVNPQEHEGRACQWMVFGIVLSFLLLMLLSVFYKFDTAAAKIMFLAMIVMNRLYYLIKTRSVSSKGTNFINGLLVISSIILIIANIETLIKIS